MSPTLQWIAVAIIVPLCALYAAWLLVGMAGRRRVAAWLATWPLPAAWRRRLQQPPQSIVRVHRRDR